MARANDWARKVLAIARGGNPAAAIAQIKVAPTVKDLKTLQKDVAAAHLLGRWPDLDTAIADNLDALSAPRLHRSP
ncbi:hypothetical protein [Xylophilus ampelinus]|uniref:Uncharacterized protein n=1 Tax=Xylophilus ampelinus TaxID=54067 RepID=A0A318SML3_9BURK|nr:hypothetical protein [Xylophilus ampelinus]MCS4509882.1 hypothetical protein [Xylophilus ampelinus]PYE78569.1 hypothetical protein DFQ15_10677 [Xylophilus ampelinus]